MTYPELKQRNILTKQCCRAGCPAQCADDGMLCLDCAENHRERNLKSMRRTRAWRKYQLLLIP